MGKAVGRSLTVAGVGLALMLSACGDSGKESSHRAIAAQEVGASKFGSDANGVGFVGADQCIGCHASVDDPATANTVEGCTSCHKNAPWAARWAGGGAIVEKYLQSGHVLHSKNIDASEANSGCNSRCHDPVGAGTTLEGRIDPAYVPAGGLAAVTCEACHGGGGRHFGQRAVPNPTPDFTVCSGCHGDSENPLPQLHLASFAEGMTIAQGYAASRHAIDLKDLPVPQGPNPFFAAGGEVKAACAKCHSDEGAKAFADKTPDQLTTTAGLAVTHQIQCRTCHDPHKPAELLLSADEANAQSAQFRTCTSCHELADADGAAATAFDHTGVVVTSTTDEYKITDSHFATPNTWKVSTVTLVDSRLGTTWKEPLPGAGANIGTTEEITVTGYAMDFGSDRVCQDCHNPCASQATINRQWRASLHADRRANGAWARNNWSDDRLDNDRRLCQKCHTSSGFKSFAASNKAGAAYAGPLSYDIAFKPEMLECWACHETNTGVVRQSGPIRADYSYVYTDKDRAKVYVDDKGKPRYPSTPVVPLVHTYEDVGSSNLCIGCHIGRQSGETVARLATNYGVTIDFRSQGSISAHDSVEGGIFFGGMDEGEGYGIGYKFQAWNSATLMWDILSPYAVKNTERHWKIGRNGVPTAESDGRGPCVSCHMSEEDGLTNHKLKSLKRDEETGEIVGPGNFCTNCHKGYGTGGVDMTLTKERLEGQEEGFRAAMAAFAAAREKSGLHWKRCSATDAAKDAVDDTYVCVWPETAAGPAQAGDFRLDRKKSGETPVQCTAEDLVKDPTDYSFLCVASGDGNTYRYEPAASGNTWWPTPRDPFAADQNQSTGRNNLGANFNYSVLSQATAGWVHNRYYAKQLIWYSIDWLDNNVIDGSVAQTLSLLPPSTSFTAAQKAKAIAYLSDLGRPVN